MPGRAMLLIGLVVMGFGVVMDQTALYDDIQEFLRGFNRFIPVNQLAVAMAIYGAGGALVFFGLMTIVFRGVGNLFSGKAEEIDLESVRVRQMEVFHEALSGAVARMAAADGDVTPSEVAMVQGILEKYTGMRLKPEEVQKLAEQGEERTKAYLAKLRKIEGQLEESQKENVVRAAFLVAVSDLNQDEREAKLLNEIADALGLDEERLARVRKSVAELSEKLVGAAHVSA